MTAPGTGGSADRRRLLAAVAVLALGPPDRLMAQVALHVSAGARWTSTLVRDSIGADAIEVAPALGPALTLGVGTRLSERWEIESVIDFSTSQLERSFDDASGDLGTLHTLAFTVVLHRALTPQLRGHFGIGALKYLPAENRGIFQEGSGSLDPLGTVGATWALPFGHRQELALQARYDYHRFTTPALTSEGFEGRRAVHRIALALRAGWTAPR